MADPAARIPPTHVVVMDPVANAFTLPWRRFFQALASSEFLTGVPPTATAAGSTGDVALDASFAYFCVAPNTWRRVAISAW